MASRKNAGAQNIPTRASRLYNISKFLKSEYSIGTSSLEECIKQHQAFCNLHDFDRPFDSDKITVQCCNCGKAIKVYYEDLSKTLFCDDCCEEQITKEHVAKLQERLLSIKDSLMQTAKL